MNLKESEGKRLITIRAFADQMLADLLQAGREEELDRIFANRKIPQWATDSEQSIAAYLGSCLDWLLQDLRSTAAFGWIREDQNQSEHFGIQIEVSLIRNPSWDAPRFLVSTISLSTGEIIQEKIHLRIEDAEDQINQLRADAGQRGIAAWIFDWPIRVLRNPIPVLTEIPVQLLREAVHQQGFMTWKIQTPRPDPEDGDSDQAPISDRIPDPDL